MKVDYVIAGCAHESSGTSYFVMNMCRALAKRGVNLTLHSFDAPVKSEDGFRSCVTPEIGGVLRPLGWCPALLRDLRKSVGNCDIVHTNGLWMMTNVYPAWAVKGTKCTLVHSPHGMLSRWALARSKWKKRIFGWLWQYRALKRADMFHVTSQKEYEEIRALGYQQPVAIIPLGVEVSKQGRRKKDRGREGEGDRLRQVVFFGRLHKVKAVDRLVQAWGLLNQSNNRTIEQWELVIAGPDNGIRGELEQYIAEHKIPRVRFVGEINGPAKYEFLSAADLYVLPSHTENFGVTVAEALACGTPVIVSKGTPWQGVEGEKEVVVESGSGTVEEREGRGRDTRSTVEDGSQTISCAARVNEIEVVPGTLGGKIALTTNPTGTTSICGTILLNGALDVNGVPLLAGDEGESEVVVGSGSGTMKRSASNTQTLKHSNNSSRCGWWVSNDPETLAKTLREAMALSDDERRRMGEAGRDWIRRDFSWEGVGAKMKAAYEWLLNGGKRPECVKID